MTFALAAYTIAAFVLLQTALGVNFEGPPPRRVRFSMRRLFVNLTATAILFGLASALAAN